MLTTSVMVVRRMLEELAGSMPNFFRTCGVITPVMPLTALVPVRVARKTTPPSASGDSGVCFQRA